ncbi:copper chaperone CopZ [Bacillus lacus]|uniref:Copper chaperone CopZ n=1 Tax=Metabacillus lacus TaxID=1983721 RepID=A0A7X2LX02_9BACI|nr:copper chaperone CopZ [Metabacillus lacus]MRX72035.1 copper chaperone CopZ [Metabacillus lacus]
MENAVLQVKGMSCNHCVKAIQSSVGALQGVNKVNVSLQEGQVEVEYSSDKASLQKIKETIDEQGYDVE